MNPRIQLDIDALREARSGCCRAAIQVAQEAFASPIWVCDGPADATDN
jgi:hypothetical protein